MKKGFGQPLTWNLVVRRQDDFDSLDFLWIEECRSFLQKHIISDCIRHKGYQFCKADTDL